MHYNNVRIVPATVPKTTFRGTIPRRALSAPGVPHMSQNNKEVEHLEREVLLTLPCNTIPPR